MDDLKAELAALRARVEALEAAKSTVRAPFHVVDEAGQSVLSVEIEDDADWGHIVRMKLVAIPDGQAMTLEASAAGAPTLQLADTVELSGYGSLRLRNEKGRSTAALSATDDDCTLTLTCSQVADRPHIQLGTSEELSHLILARGGQEEGVWRGGGILLTVDQQRAATLQVGKGNPKGQLELSADEERGGQMTLRNHQSNEIIQFP